MLMRGYDCVPSYDSVHGYDCGPVMILCTMSPKILLYLARNRHLFGGKQHPFSSLQHLFGGIQHLSAVNGYNLYEKPRLKVRPGWRNKVTTS